MEFWWSIPQKGASIGHFGARDDPAIRIRKLFWWNRAFEAVEAIEVAEAGEVKEAAEVTETWKIITEDFRVIHAFKLSFIFMFEKTIFGYNHEIFIEF